MGSSSVILRFGHKVDIIMPKAGAWPAPKLLESLNLVFMWTNRKINEQYSGYF